MADSIVRKATLSRDQAYRYTLTRTWDEELPAMTFVMLNPSTADGLVDDPTIRRCVGFARREKCGGIQVLNLYALRAADPKKLKEAADPYGPNNQWYLHQALSTARGPVVCAWGTNGGEGVERFLAVRGEAQLMCLGLTKEGHPVHPLYVKADAPLVPYGPGAQLTLL